MAVNRNGKMYIQRRSLSPTGRKVVETVAVCHSNAEAIQLLKELSKAQPNASFYTKTTPCKSFNHGTIKPENLQTSDDS